MNRKSLFLLIIFISVAIGNFLLLSYLKPDPPPVKNQQQVANPLIIIKPVLRDTVTLLAVGDILLAREVARRSQANHNRNHPFTIINGVLKQADIVFANFEAPITVGPPVPSGSTIFHADPGVEKVLKENNIAIVSLANNHTPNFGEQGLRDTFRYLDNAGIYYVGAGTNEDEAYRPVYLTKNGLTIAFLAYNDNDVVPPNYRAQAQKPGTAFIDIKKMTTAVQLAKKETDIIIVSMHAGNEYSQKPNTSQTAFAHAAIDAGADLIIGHHPHVIQPAEIYNDKYIFYSLGNFIFDQPWPRTKEGIMLKIVFDNKTISAIEPLPLVIENLSQPRLATTAEKSAILEQLKLAN